MAFGHSEFRVGAAPMSEINTTPLVDVMLVLLIIFMVTAPLMTQSIGIDLPRTSAAPARQDAPRVALLIDAGGGLQWDGQPLDPSRLQDSLHAAALRVPMPELHIHADRDTRYEQIAVVLAAARSAGIQSVGFVTLPERKP